MFFVGSRKESKWVYNSNFVQLYTTLLYSIKLSEYKIRINSDKNPLAVERNNYLSKIVNEFKNLRITCLEQLVW